MALGLFELGRAVRNLYARIPILARDSEQGAQVFVLLPAGKVLVYNDTVEISDEFSATAPFDATTASEVARRESIVRQLKSVC